MVKAANKGDSVAFSELVRRFENKLFRIAKTMLFDEQLAGDAVQETFLRAFRGVTRFRFRAGVYTWLYAIVRNVCREMNRKNKAPVKSRAWETESHELDEPIDISTNPEHVISTERRLHKVIKKN